MPWNALTVDQHTVVALHEATSQRVPTLKPQHDNRWINVQIELCICFDELQNYGGSLMDAEQFLFCKN